MHMRDAVVVVNEKQIAEALKAADSVLSSLLYGKRSRDVEPALEKVARLRNWYESTLRGA